MPPVLSADAIAAATNPSAMARSRSLVEHYFAAIAANDLGRLESLLAPDLRMRCAGGRGTTGLVEFDCFDDLARDLRHNAGVLYDPAVGIQPEILNLLAEGDRVAAEVRIRGRSAQTGAPYDNLYAFFFWIRAGVIVEIHEHLDTAYVGETLLAPAGIATGVDMPWLRRESRR